MHKYNAKRTVIDGINFDSRAEANRYCELKLLERAGKIKALTLQPKFELQPKFKKNGKAYRAITYIADFMYNENGRMVVEDVKGVKTEGFKLKQKMFEYHYPEFEIKIV